MDKPVDAAEAAELGLVTEAFDDIDWPTRSGCAGGAASLSPTP